MISRSVSTLVTLSRCPWTTATFLLLVMAQPDPQRPAECCCPRLLAPPYHPASLCSLKPRISLPEEGSLFQGPCICLRKHLLAHPNTRTLGVLSLLGGVTAQQLILRTAGRHSSGLARELLHSSNLGRGEGALSPSFLASVNLCHALLGCRGTMAPVSQDLGGQSLPFQKKILFQTVMDQEAHHLPDLGPRSHQSLPCSLGNMGHLPTETAGDSHLLILVGPEEELRPSLKNARTHMGRRENSRTRHTTRWQVPLLSVKDQTRPSSWGTGHPSNLEARDGPC